MLFQMICIFLTESSVWSKKFVTAPHQGGLMDLKSKVLQKDPTLERSKIMFQGNVSKGSVHHNCCTPFVAFAAIVAHFL